MSAESHSQLPAVGAMPWLEELRTLLGDRVSVAAAVRDHHRTGVSHHTGAPPDAVVFPESTEEVSAVVRICARHRVPAIPFGTGTSAEDHVAAVRGGICIDLSGMNRILAVNAEDFDVVIQPGVTRKQLNEHLRDTGLFFPIDPGADASLGGMTATRASGTNAVRYGTMRDNVVSLQVVLPDGRIIRTARRARKSSAGYDLTRLYVGSEGTLGVVTEITLRVHPIPEAISAAVCSFTTVADAIDAVIQTIQAGIPVARIEFMDAVQMQACRAYSKLDHPAAPTLFYEFHGTPAGVEEQAVLASSIAAENGGGIFQWASSSEDRSRLWKARHDSYFAALALRPGASGWPTDVCVPLSRLAECVTLTVADLKESGLVAPICAHAGDGNFHLILLIRMDDPAERAAAEALCDRLVRRAHAMDGTCTGEHGIGLGKLKHMVEEHGDAVSVMAAIKHALDPLDIMNPGKLVPDLD